MFLVSTRNFHPEIGGMQSLMEGLSNALLNHGPVKIFAENIEHAEVYDQNSSLNIERISGFKIFRKYRKANLVRDFIKNNSVRALFFDHWKSIENIDNSSIFQIPSFCLIHSKEINHEKGSPLNKRMLKSFNDEQLQMIEKFINPSFWPSKLKSYPADHMLVQDTAREAKIV